MGKGRGVLGQLSAKVITNLVAKAKLVEILLSVLAALGPIRSQGCHCYPFAIMISF